MDIKYDRLPVVRLGPPYEPIIVFKHLDGYNVVVEVGPQREYERPPEAWKPLDKGAK